MKSFWKEIAVLNKLEEYKKQKISLAYGDIKGHNPNKSARQHAKTTKPAKEFHVSSNQKGHRDKFQNTKADYK